MGVVLWKPDFKEGEINMERVMVCGEEKDIISELSKYIDSGDVRIFVRSLPAFSELIEDDEVLKISKGTRDQERGMGFMIPKTNYYINLKMTTIAFIGLLLDVEFTKGFASFILSIFGVAADVIRKLSDMEKCVLFLVKEEAVLAKEDKYTLRDSLQCINYARECGYRQYDKCSLQDDILTDTVKELLGKKIVKQAGNLLVYRF